MAAGSNNHEHRSTFALVLFVMVRPTFSRPHSRSSCMVCFMPAIVLIVLGAVDAATKLWE